MCSALPCPLEMIPLGLDPPPITATRDPRGLDPPSISVPHRPSPSVTPIIASILHPDGTVPPPSFFTSSPLFEVGGTESDSPPMIVINGGRAPRFYC